MNNYVLNSTEWSVKSKFYYSVVRKLDKDQADLIYNFQLVVSYETRQMVSCELGDISFAHWQDCRENEGVGHGKNDEHLCSHLSGGKIG